MRTVLAVAVLALACARETESPPPAAPLSTAAGRAPLSLAGMRAPRKSATGVIAGVVTKRSDLHEAMLESGGPNQIPLRLDASTQVTLDGQPAKMIDILEGQLVRASYKMGADGAPLAIKVVANSKPVSQK